MRGRYSGEEVIGIANHHARLVEGKLSMEEDLRGLRHARDGFDGEVAQGVDGPGVLVRVKEAQAVRGVSEEVQDELGVCLD
jgi:hypothetical protein